MTHSNDNHGSVWPDGSLTSGPVLSDTLLPSHIRGCQYTQLQCVCGGGVCDWDVCVCGVGVGVVCVCVVWVGVGYVIGTCVGWGRKILCE